MPECPDTYHSPKLVDGGAVEERTQNSIEGSNWEHFDNIIWGQEVTDSRDEIL
jgi:hypothetical protein